MPGSLLLPPHLSPLPEGEGAGTALKASRRLPAVEAQSSPCAGCFGQRVTPNWATSM